MSLPASPLPDAPGVYLILNRHTGRRWVGKTTSSIRLRAQQHRRSFIGSTTPLGLMAEDLARYGSDAFVFLVLEAFPKPELVSRAHLRHLERQWAQHLQALDQRQGYNLEAGGLRSPASLFRDHERKVLRGRPPKYAFLPGVRPEAPIDEALLVSWFAGHRHSAA